MSRPVGVGFGARTVGAMDDTPDQTPGPDSDSPAPGPRDDERSGLMWVELESETAAPSEKRDPWGTIVRTVAAKAA